jgi:alkylhydroperoxidase/carboxymuconolactone decarboxylase family protein YurZ
MRNAAAGDPRNWIRPLWTVPIRPCLTDSEREGMRLLLRNAWLSGARRDHSSRMMWRGPVLLFDRSTARRWAERVTTTEGKAPMVDEGATPVLDVITTLTATAVETTTLDPGLQVLLRFAALVALDAAPASYLFHLVAGAEQGLTMADAQQVLITLAPLVGTARIVSASTHIARALGLAIAISDAAEN